MNAEPIRFTADDLPAYPAKWAGTWGAAHLHTAAAQVFGEVPLLSPVADRSEDAGPSAALEIPTSDGTGDRLAADLFLPEDERPNRPLVVLLHGLGGDADSAYMRACLSDLLGAGLRVVALNFRGAGRSHETCSEYLHPGRTGDVRALLTYLEEGTERDLFESGVILCGFSLGGSILLKSLATADPDVLRGVRAAVTVSAPLDLASCSRRLGRGRNRVYEAYLLKRMRDQIHLSPGGVNDEELAAVEAASTVWAFDETFTAPRRGFDDVEAYYHEDSAGHRLGKIAVPTLLLVADDDPFVPLETYDQFDWEAHPHLVKKRTPTGGHTGFLCESGPLYHSRCVMTLAEKA
ncbi:YheT family hydrolase [Alienimonas californiensis]|uniref:Putative hydrolase n=1 Tax=Alienimonas californiensis TaxID=2527989 RepID=A0A517P8A8_9PLAN|nr:alpha/beta fold hydrolase [Alienimonas californiensis]QDT15618.1 putative hydrolase [Alienimonas californiensis]